MEIQVPSGPNKTKEYTTTTTSYYYYYYYYYYDGRTESHEQQFFACELGTADEGEYCRRMNQLLCYP